MQEQFSFKNTQYKSFVNLTIKNKVTMKLEMSCVVHLKIASLVFQRTLAEATHFGPLFRLPRQRSVSFL